MSLLSPLISLDYKITDIVIQYRNEWCNSFFFIITKLGTWYIILILFIIVAIILFLNKKRDIILPFAVSVFSSGIFAFIIKYLVGRDRPGENIALYTEVGPSFPSAHAALIFSFFGFLIYYVFTTTYKKPIKLVLSVFFSSIIILVGFSRIYLGVHYLSDVLAGYLLALISIMITVFFMRR